MKAPEKLYLHPTAKGEVGASWLTFSLTNEDIEYTRTDALLDLLNKMPSCITVDGLDYYFVMKKASIYMAYYKGNGEEGRGNAIFGITAHSPIDLLTEMLDKLKEKGLLE